MKGGLDPRLRLGILLGLFVLFLLVGWRTLLIFVAGSGEDAKDALGSTPMPVTRALFSTPSMAELAAAYHLEFRRADCSVCHTGKPEEKIFNPFGAAYQSILRRDYPQMESIFELSQVQVRKGLRELLADGLDSDGDGYDSGLELLFGFLPGDPESKSSLPVATLERYREALRRAGEDGTLLQSRAARTSTRDSDGDGVPDDLERFFGFDPNSSRSVPLVRTDRLVLYRAVLERP